MNDTKPGERHAYSEDSGVRETIEVREAIEAGYARWIAAFRARDLGACMAVLTEDFTLTTPDGTALDHSQIRGEMKAQLTSLRCVEAISIRVSEMQRGHSTATVLMTEEWDGVMADERGTERRMHCGETYRDRWQETPEGWLLQHSVLLTTQMRWGGSVAPA